MVANLPLPRRRSIRLTGYDYTLAGAYYVTINAKEDSALFGEMSDDHVVLNAFGRIASACWLVLPRHFPNVELDAWVVMPNHLHGIIVIVHDEGTGEAFAGQADEYAEPRPANASPVRISPSRPNGTDTRSLGAIVQNYKSISARRINAVRGTPGGVVWQRNYYEHVIRNEESLNRIRTYIANNPAQKEVDLEGYW